MMWQREKQKNLSQQAMNLEIQELLRYRMVQGYYNNIEFDEITICSLKVVENVH